MSRLRNIRITPGTVLAGIALFLALGGVSYAATALPRNSVTTAQVKDHSLLAKDFARGQIAEHPAGIRGTTPSSYNQLYRNNGNGTFTNVSRQAGILREAGYGLGVAVADLDEAVNTYERVFGARVEHRERVPDQGVEAASLRVGDGRVELLASLGAETPVGKFLAKRGPGMHHVAYEVPDVRAAIDELAGQGVELVDEEPREGLFGLQVAFLHPDALDGVLAELVADG